MVNPKSALVFSNRIPKFMDAAFRWKNGNAYFFKNTQYWKFNDKTGSAFRSYPRDTGYNWYNCTRPKVKGQCSEESKKGPLSLFDIEESKGTEP